MPLLTLYFGCAGERSSTSSIEEFNAIQKAWEVLQDDKLRQDAVDDIKGMTHLSHVCCCTAPWCRFLALTDAMHKSMDVAARRRETTLDKPSVSEAVSLNECEISPDGSTFSYDCRCGGIYELEKDWLVAYCKENSGEGIHVDVECSSCSFVLGVVIPAHYPSL